jgi:hypothetical protein
MDRRVALPLVILVSGCIHVFQSIRPRPLDPHTPVYVTTPVKAHLVDGSTVVFKEGVTVDNTAVRGAGQRFDLTLRATSPVTSLPLDSIAGMEAFEQSTNAGSSLLISVLATGVTGLGVGLAAIAIFGSCPTVYADSAGTALLQAEGFSYSIAPIFESRDVDRLRVVPAADGSVRLEVRNEALETHFLNHLELLAVTHKRTEAAFVDELNRLVVVADEQPLTTATDRRGADVSRRLAAWDGDVYHTDARTMNRAQLTDLDDWIDLTAPAPPGADSVAIVLRLRNSLLNTTLLYDVMLGDPGARSLDWVGKDLKQVGPALAVAQWYQQRMGMNVAVRDGSQYRVVAHLRDTGPIAWKDVTIVVPVVTAGSVRVRLTFPMDNWRIDRVVVAERFRRVSPAVFPLAEVREGTTLNSTALASMYDADSRYLQTSPGQRFSAVFRPDANPGEARTYFLAAQGYYMEWVRPNWLRGPRADHAFVPSDTALVQALGRWRMSQDSLEALFATTRIPVR